LTTTICLDFGNTRKKCAIFNTEIVAKIIVLNENYEAHLTQIIEEYKPTKSILSSVTNHSVIIEDLLQQNTQFHKLKNQSKLPFSLAVSKPETVGADRLALCSAMVKKFPNHHSLSIALGSCITYNFVNKFQEFLGGGISPGLNMRYKSMNDFTANLPNVPAEKIFPLIGYDTKTNLQSGVQHGMACEIDGIIKKYQEKFTDLKVVITGGDAVFFQNHLETNCAFEPNLLFEGLKVICNMN
jgi:type III pantothenate kinase